MNEEESSEQEIPSFDGSSGSNHMAISGSVRDNLNSVDLTGKYQVYFNVFLDRPAEVNTVSKKKMTVLCKSDSSGMYAMESMILYELLMMMKVRLINALCQISILNILKYLKSADQIVCTYREFVDLNFV